MIANFPLSVFWNSKFPPDAHPSTLYSWHGFPTLNWSLINVVFIKSMRFQSFRRWNEFVRKFGLFISLVGTIRLHLSRFVSCTRSEWFFLNGWYWSISCRAFVCYPSIWEVLKLHITQKKVLKKGFRGNSDLTNTSWLSTPNFPI